MKKIVMLGIFSLFSLTSYTSAQSLVADVDINKPYDTQVVWLPAGGINNSNILAGKEIGRINIKLNGAVSLVLEQTNTVSDSNHFVFFRRDGKIDANDESLVVTPYISRTISPVRNHRLIINNLDGSVISISLQKVNEENLKPGHYVANFSLINLHS